MKKIYKNKGFTLIETILYLALFSIVIGGGMVATYAIIQSSDAGENHVILQEEANFLLRKIDWAMTGATTITTPANSTPTTNLVVTKNISGTPTQLTFNFSNPNMTLQRGSGSAITLNSSSISVSAVSFQKTSTGNGVTATFTLTTVQNGRNSSQTFSTTKYLRK